MFECVISREGREILEYIEFLKCEVLVSEMHGWKNFHEEQGVKLERIRGSWIMKQLDSRSETILENESNSFIEGPLMMRLYIGFGQSWGARGEWHSVIPLAFFITRDKPVQIIIYEALDQNVVSVCLDLS